MLEVILEILAESLVELIFAGLAILFAWVGTKIGTNQKLKNINEAKGELEDAALQTVTQLKQTTVDDLKAAAADGKLTSVEIDMLKSKTLKLVMAKLSEPSKKVLIAAGVDLNAYIHGAAEKWVEYVNKSK